MKKYKIKWHIEGETVVEAEDPDEALLRFNALSEKQVVADYDDLVVNGEPKELVREAAK